MCIFVGIIILVVSLAGICYSMEYQHTQPAFLMGKNVTTDPTFDIERMCHWLRISKILFVVVFVVMVVI